MQPFSLWQAQFSWQGCEDARPWLIFEVGLDHLDAFPISGHCYQGQCFELSRDHPDFVATGLKKTCYIHDQHIYRLPRECVIRPYGMLRGDLLTEFRAYAGL